MMNNKVVVVLGMHRSGTSTVALILQELGVNMGDRLLGASSSNPYGHGEDEDFLDLHNIILKDAKGSWDFPPAQHKLKESFENYKDQVKELICKKKIRTIWGWKEPRTTLISKYYHELLENAYYIYIDRDELEVAQSLKKRNKMPIRKGIKLSQRYKNELNFLLNEYKQNKLMNINFSELHDQKENIVSRFIEFLEINPTQDQINKAREIIKPLDNVRGKREKLKRNENINNYKKVFKHPIKAINFIFREVWRLLKYHLGV